MIPPPVPTKPTLDYAKRPPLRWISRHRRLLIFVSICFAVAAPTWWYWAPLKHRVLWLYWFHQAANHVMPSSATDVVVNAPVLVTKIPTTNPDYVKAPSNPPILTYEPLSYRQLKQVDSRLNMISALSSVIFMGTLKRPDGASRLVIVTGGPGVHNQLLDLTSVLVLPFPSLFDPLPPASLPQIGFSFAYGGPPPNPTHLQTGLTDPRDPSHIIFQFIAGQAGGGMLATVTSADPITGGGIIDAYLKNDDSLEFTLRSSWGISFPGLGHRSIIAGDQKSLTAAAVAQAGYASRGPATNSANRGKGAPPGR